VEGCTRSNDPEWLAVAVNDFNPRLALLIDEAKIERDDLSHERLRIITGRLGDEVELAVPKSIKLDRLRPAIDEEQLADADRCIESALLARAITSALDLDHKVRSAKPMGIADLGNTVVKAEGHVGNSQIPLPIRLAIGDVDTGTDIGFAVSIEDSHQYAR